LGGWLKKGCIFRISIILNAMVLKYLVCILAVISAALSIYGQRLKDTLYGGTSIIMIYMKDSIWLAADSKVVPTAKIGNDQTKIIDTCACKIVQVNNVISASSGHFAVDLSNNVVLYDVSIETRKALSKGRNIRDAINIFSDITIKYLTRIINSIDKDSLLSFFNGDDLISTVFGTFLSNNCYAALLEFKLVGDKNKWHVDTVLKEHRSEEAGITMGFKDEINGLLHKNPFYLRSNTPMEDKLRYLIKLEIEKRRDKVGGPIDVIVLYRSGFMWLPKKRKGC
jgi:hypothetical protein